MGAIVGGVIGSVVGLALIIGVLYFIIRRRSLVPTELDAGPSGSGKDYVADAKWVGTPSPTCDFGMPQELDGCGIRLVGSVPGKTELEDTSLMGV